MAYPALVYGQGYLPAAFQGPVPAPLPPCTDPLPDEQAYFKQEKQKSDLEHREQAAKKQQKSGGLLNKLSASIEQAAISIEKDVRKFENSMKREWSNMNYEGSENKFIKEFNLGPTEKLFWEYWCNIVNGNQVFDGSAFLSNNYWCFLTTSPTRFKIMIPLVSILSIQKLSTLPSKDYRYPPSFVAAGDNTKKDALALYTGDGKVHYFFNFWNYERAYNALDHKWRAALAARAQPNPVPYVQPPVAPYPGQPYPGQPYPGQPYPGQPAPGAPYPGQPGPYPGQPTPGAPYPGQPAPGQPYPGQPAPGATYPGQPAPGATYPGQPAPYPGQPAPAGPYPGQPVYYAGSAVPGAPVSYPGGAPYPQPGAYPAQPYPGQPAPSAPGAYPYPGAAPAPAGAKGAPTPSGKPGY